MVEQGSLVMDEDTKATMEKAFWNNFFDEGPPPCYSRPSELASGYFNNYLGPGAAYQDDLLEHLPSFEELCKVSTPPQLPHHTHS